MHRTSRFPDCNNKTRATEINACLLRAHARPYFFFLSFKVPQMQISMHDKLHRCCAYMSLARYALFSSRDVDDGVRAHARVHATHVHTRACTHVSVTLAISTARGNTCPCGPELICRGSVGDTRGKASICDLQH